MFTHKHTHTKKVRSQQPSESPTASKMFSLYPCCCRCCRYCCCCCCCCVSLLISKQSCGQVLESAWPVILDLLRSVAKGATDAALPASPRTPVSAIEEGEMEAGFSGDGSGSGGDTASAGEGDEGVFGVMGGDMEMRPVVWGGACLSLAFKCLQLVVDEFLERLPREQVPRLVVCAGAFGGQTESVNLSLTAIGMLWTVCDTFADATATSPGGSPRPGKQKEGCLPSSRPPSPSLGVDKAPVPVRPSLHSMWPTMLLQLRSLAVDFRPELRNCAVNTLFSAAVGNGYGLTESEWKQFLLDVTFPLIEQVLKSTNSASRGANTAVAPELKKGVRMLMHHTRDTDQKQWNETRVLAMQVQCVCMVCIHHFSCVCVCLCDSVCYQVHGV